MNQNTTKAVFRILDANYLIKYCGTEQGSWFTLEAAKKVVDRSKGEMIYQFSDDYQNALWEVMG